MNKYYCPYCNIKYKSNRNDKSKDLVCKQCGDILFKYQFFDFKKIFALIALSSFVIPLFLSLSFFMKNEKQNKEFRNHITSISTYPLHK